jgi:DNA methylase
VAEGAVVSADLRLGRWQDVLADVTCDALIVDAPYSERTHESHSARTDVLTACARDAKWAATGGQRQTISYDKWTPEHVMEFCGHWSERTSGWFVSITDHVLAPVWERVLQSLGRYVFAPLPLVETGSRVRLAGDGPSSWTCWVIVARPKTREFQRWGTLQGAYVDTNERKPVVGGKPLGIMRAIVRDYSRPGDLICDPCAGGGTTLLAALTEGRRAVGAEMDPKHYEIARKRLAKGFTPPLFVDRPEPAKQEAMFDDGKGE